jgi:hypothetical protein
VRSGQWECTEDVTTRSQSGNWSDTPREGAPKRDTLYAGRLGGRQHRTALNFAWDFADIGTLRKAELVLHTSHRDFVPPGTSLRAYRLSSGFSEVDNHSTFQTDCDQNPSYVSGSVWSGHVDPALDAESRIDITTLVGRFLPTSKQVLDSAGKHQSGGGQDKHGIYIFAASQEHTGSGLVFHSDEATTIGFRPYIYYEYDPPNYKPDLVNTIQPSGTKPKTQPFTGEFTDPNGDRPKTIEVDVHKVSNHNHVWGIEAPFDPSWTEFGGIWTWSIDAPSSNDLATGVPYEWRARGTDPSGAVSDWSAGWRTFTRSGTGPSLTTITHPASLPTFQGFHFAATWTVEAGERIVSSRIHLRKQADPWALALWDESFSPMTTEEMAFSPPQVYREYGGPNLDPGTYVWQAQVTDSQGLSAWSDERTVTLVVGSEPANDTGGDGPPPNVTGYARHRANVRVMLRKADAAGRGPGTLVGIIEDPTNLGFRTVVNAPGEMYFTLPALHPQAGICEPWQTHYAVQQYRNGAWVDLANGLLNDFDAGDNDIIIYGLDYLGVLSKTVDHRWPNGVDPDSDHAHGGAKYVHETISHIIRDQLDEAHDQPDSTVGFISSATADGANIDSLPTEISIFSTFKQRLDFIRGLIDSNKSGLGLRTRLKARFNPSTRKWVWDLRNTTGKDRDNLRLEYGSLLQNFRIIALGPDFSTKVHAVGTTPSHIKPHYEIYPTASGGDFWTDTFGLNQTVLTMTDIADNNDLKRRVRQARAEAARVGKQVWVAVRVHGIDPLDGYDLMDSIPLDIDRGMVETDRYGSGYWTIHGTEWRLFADGHDELSLIIRPREDESVPDPDLLPSDPIHDQPEWALGTGVPTMSAAFVPDAEFYLDTSSMMLYQRTVEDDPTVWTPVADMSGGGGGGGGLPPPPGAPTLGVPTAPVVVQPDGTIVTSLQTAWTAPAGTPPEYYVVQMARDAAFTAPLQYTTTALSFRITPVAPYVQVWLRVRGFGQFTVPAPWSNVQTITPGGDPFAPPIPDKPSLIPGYKLIGVTWPRIEVADLGRYGVRWVEGSATAPNADVDGNIAWTNIVTLANSVVVNGLDIGTPTTTPVVPPKIYWFQVRAVDSSNNVLTSATDATPVNADSPEGKEAGWSLMEHASPSVVGTEDLAVSTLVAEFLHSGEIDAGMITTGTLKVGGAGVDAIIEVRDSDGNLTARWDEDGILVINPAARGQAVWIGAGVVHTTNAYDDTLPVTSGSQQWTNSVTGDGINASAITFGISPGGHNNLPNSGFELTPFINLTSKVWTTAADWATGLSLVNADVSTVDLKLTTATY